MHLLFFLAVLVATACLARAIVLQRQLRLALLDPAYDILTRAGGEMAWRRLRHQDVAIIFTDLDDLHMQNSTLGYAEVNRRIATALRIRHNDVTIAMRWFSGDEIVVVVRGDDGVPMAERLLAALREQGLSGTFAVRMATTNDLNSEVGSAAALVQAAKAANLRGVVLNEGLPDISHP